MRRRGCRASSSSRLCAFGGFFCDVRFRLFGFRCGFGVGSGLGSGLASGLGSGWLRVSPARAAAHRRGLRRRLRFRCVHDDQLGLHDVRPHEQRALLRSASSSSTASHATSACTNSASTNDNTVETTPHRPSPSADVRRVRDQTDALRAGFLQNGHHANDLTVVEPMIRANVNRCIRPRAENLRRLFFERKNRHARAFGGFADTRD